jgi:hypothetical protein
MLGEKDAAVNIAVKIWRQPRNSMKTHSTDLVGTEGQELIV